MENVAKLIYRVGKVSGRNEKLALLKNSADVPGFKEVLQFIFNPYIRTGIAEKKLAKGAYMGSDAADLVITFQDAIKYFTEHQTGSDSDVAFALRFINAQQTQEEKDLAKAICTKTLTIGVTEKSLNSVYGDDFIPKIGCMLGEKYTEFKGKVKGPFIVTEKLDGIRRILVKENGNISLYSRSGQPDEGLVEIEEEAKHLPDNTVFDGELLAKGNYKDSIALRQATNSIANKKGVRKGVVFNVFDSIPLEDFKHDTAVESAIQRKVLLGALFGDESIKHLTANYEMIIQHFKLDHDFVHIKPVPILGVIQDDSGIAALVEPIWKRGGEGVMLNTMSGTYKIKRSRDLLKVKKVESLDLKIVDFEEGTGKYAGMLGALVVDYKGRRVGVGSGLDDLLRSHIWNNKADYLGKTVEIDTFGESTNQAGEISLNCPIFKGIRYDK